MAHGSALATQNGLTFPAAFPWYFGLQFISAELLAENYLARRNCELKAHDLGHYDEFVARKPPEEILCLAYEWLVETLGL